MGRREYPESPIPAVGVIIISDERALLTRRGNPPRRGAWSLPGGGIEVGETAREAARREVSEELGIQIDLYGVIDVVDIITHDDVGRVQYHFVIADFLGLNPRGGVHPASDVLEAQWATETELPAFDLPEITIAVIRKAFAMARAR
jgi:ADP-ribose pyrophosphatase YjhB (NUDIX family)